MWKRVLSLVVAAAPAVAQRPETPVPTTNRRAALVKSATQAFARRHWERTRALLAEAKPQFATERDFSAATEAIYRELPEVLREPQPGRTEHEAISLFKLMVLVSPPDSNWRKRALSRLEELRLAQRG